MPKKKIIKCASSKLKQHVVSPYIAPTVMLQRTISLYATADFQLTYCHSQLTCCSHSQLTCCSNCQFTYCSGLSAHMLHRTVSSYDTAHYARREGPKEVVFIEIVRYVDHQENERNGACIHQRHQMSGAGGDHQGWRAR